MTPVRERAEGDFLARLGERIRLLRDRRGMSRRELSTAAGVSQRHLWNLESGVGNASVLVLLQVAQALQSRLADLLIDEDGDSDLFLIHRLLAGQSEATLKQVQDFISRMVGTVDTSDRHLGSGRVALVGLRGAGKASLGKRLAVDFNLPFVDLGREVERLAGRTVGEIRSLGGAEAYRRYGRRATEETIRAHPTAVIVVPSAIVGDPEAYEQLLAACTTVWLQARPKDHIDRVSGNNSAQPIANLQQATRDLTGVLARYAPMLERAELKLDTSAQGIEETYGALRSMVVERPWVSGSSSPK